VRLAASVLGSRGHALVAKDASSRAMILIMYARNHNLAGASYVGCVLISRQLRGLNNTRIAACGHDNVTTYRLQLLTTQRAYARRFAASLIEGVF
jgi:hypothetical protein